MERDPKCCGNFKPGEDGHVDPTYLGLTILADKVETAGNRIAAALFGLALTVAFVGGVLTH